MPIYICNTFRCLLSLNSASVSRSTALSPLVLVTGRVVAGRDDETATLGRSAVDGLDNVDHLLLVGNGPVDLVVVTGTQVNHDVLVTEREMCQPHDPVLAADCPPSSHLDSPVKEHERTLVIQLVHLGEVWHFCNVDQVDGGKVLHLFAHAVERLVHGHALRVVVVAKADAHNTVFLNEDGLQAVSYGQVVGQLGTGRGRIRTG